ncbi:MAG: type II toxin-antitoxin system Phd/YefM family antitoxin [Myxococcales bacterium]|nr:type II toxin-antitoxin system Phd/YefM family antitoxin [Myxococcales bacterium]
MKIDYVCIKGYLGDMPKSTKGKNDDLVVNVHEAKTHFSKLLRRVQSGQSVVIAKASKPIARIVPLREAASSGRSFGAFKGWIECAPDAFDASDEVADLFETGDIFPG